MDSLKNQSGPMMKIWRLLFGGTEGPGMTKLMIFLAGYILIGGLVFAFLTR